MTYKNSIVPVDDIDSSGNTKIKQESRVKRFEAVSTSLKNRIACASGVQDY